MHGQAGDELIVRVTLPVLPRNTRSSATREPAHRHPFTHTRSHAHTHHKPPTQANAALLCAENFRVFLGLTVMVLNQIRRRCGSREVSAVHVADLENILFRTRTQSDAAAQRRTLVYYMLQRLR